MTPKPDFLPAWATEDQLDPITGQYNVVMPPSEKELSGWTFEEKPNRQWWNWLQRQTYLWIKYFNENLDFDSDTITPTWTGLTFQPTTNNFFYSKQGDIIYFTCKMEYSLNTDFVNPLTISDMPFPGITETGFGQSVPCIRSNAAVVTAPTGNQLATLIGSNSIILRVIEINASTGLINDLVAKGAQGQLIITGFYFTN